MEIPFKYKHLRSYVAGRKPTPSQILEGQFAINVPDKKIYTKDSSGNIVDLTDYVDIDILERTYIKQGVLPLTQIGNMGGIQPLPFVSLSSSLIRSTADIPILLSGRTYTYNANTSTTVPSNMINGTNILVYFTLDNGNIRLTLSQTPINESIGVVYIGTIRSRSGGFDINLNTVTRLDIYRLSSTNVGSAIPISGGTPDRKGYMDSSWGFLND